MAKQKETAVQSTPQQQLVKPSLYDTIFDVTDPEGALVQAKRLVRAMSKECTGDSYIVNMRDKKYPTVCWWTTMGAMLGCIPRQHKVERLPRRSGAVCYEAEVGVYRGDELVTIGSALCSQEEKKPSKAGWEEYAIRSMAITRAIGKAYRQPMNFLAALAGLEATPAEEMPGFDAQPPQGAPQAQPQHAEFKEAPTIFETWWGNLERARSVQQLTAAWEACPKAELAEPELAELSAFYQHRRQEIGKTP